MGDDMREIRLGGGYVALVDKADFDFLNQWDWTFEAQAPAHRPRVYAYRRGWRGPGRLLMHRFIMNAGPGERVRHLNGNSLDNRRSNLACKLGTPMPADKLAKINNYRASVRAGHRVPNAGRHRLLEISADKKTGVCAVCGPVETARRKSKRESPDGYAYSCAVKRSEERGREKGVGVNRSKISGRQISAYRKHKRQTCERCGFVPVHPIQLDVHHRDFNHCNNTIENLETVCANCHRLDHWVHGRPMSERIASAEAVP